jgi:hypothetical protein
MIHIFDIECFRYDWLAVFKDIRTGEYTAIHNDNAAVKRFMSAERLLCGFNSKHYDNYMLTAILCGANNALLKEINDLIVAGGLGFEHWFIRQSKRHFNSFDIRDDMQMGLSLKAIEGHLGLPIKETAVPFDIDRPLTAAEIDEVIEYCKHDVDATETLLRIRKPYLEGKLTVGRMKNISDEKALAATNAKLTAMFLGATAREHNDKRGYKCPSNLKRELIPREVFDFFDRGPLSGKLTFQIGECLLTVGGGGLHGAIDNYLETSNGADYPKL